MKTLNHLLLTTAAVLTLAGCNKTDFSSIAAGPAGLDIPVDPPPPGPTPSSKLSSGVCNTDSSTQVLSCLKCDVPQVVAVPQLSAKAQALYDVMALSCNVANKSDPVKTRATLAQMLNKLNQASPVNYPESTRTAMMTMVIQGLTNPNDNSLRQKMFGGLWYQPPYSDAFETYFGLTTQDAKNILCYTDTVTAVPGIYSKDYMDCQYTDVWPNCKEKPEYVAGLKYNQQLENSLQLGVTNPYTKPTPDPQKKCSWDKFEGDDIIAALKKLKEWKAAGRKVSLAVKNASGAESCGDAVESNIKEGSTVQMATYKCE